MAYAYSVTRVTISGLSFGGAEEWSTGFFVGYAGAGASNPTQTAVDNIATRWATYFNAANAEIANDFTTTQVKMAQLNTDGTTMPNNVVYHTYTTPPAGGNISIQYPPQITLACTLTTANVRGLAAKGRMFLPGVAHSVGTTGKVSSTTIGLHATLLQTFFNGVNTDLGVAGDIILASFGSTTPTVQAGVNATVTGMKLGDVFDTQRRRRNQLVETYTARSIT